MASRKEQKEAARARRLEEEQARAARQRQRRRMQMLGGVILAAVAVVVVAIAISSGGGSSNAQGLQKGSQQTQVVSQVSNLLRGIPQSGKTLGRPSAPVTMTYYGDLQCPVCRDFTVSGGFPQLVANDVRSGKVKVVYRAFQTATQDPTVFQTQQVAALAAGQQNHFWDFAELFYHQQGQEGTNYVTGSYLTGLAQQIPGLNLSSWSSARSNGALASQVSADGVAGHAAGVQGTPTLIFKGPKGQSEAPSGVPTYSDLQGAIKQVS